MPEPLKNLYTKELISNLAHQIKMDYSSFDASSFISSVMDDDWKNKELKQRMRHITLCLHQNLPSDYQQAIAILVKTFPHFSGFEYMFFPEYAELYGMDDFEVSVSFLEVVTQYSSSEFAVRPFIIKYPAEMMKVMMDWTQSKNEHVRRLATEGCRPRLPWAMALPAFKKDPTEVLQLLDKLKDDESLFVRRSVANNLNDIAKDHPNTVAEIAKQWKGKSKERDWLVKHACRTLLKQAHPDVMALYGYTKPNHIDVTNFDCEANVAMGEKLHFSFNLTTQSETLGKLRIEFAINFLKSNGKLSKKVFKISEADYPSDIKKVEKYFSFKAISTRKYYEGEHQLLILVNGDTLAKKTFTLLPTS